jgi:hypothetical protein
VKKKLTALCDHDECHRRAKAKHECLTCEKQEKAFAVHACGHHADWGTQTIKRHALVKHPVNLLRAVGHQLKGEDIL